jgi:hypothetical protein
MHEADPHSRLAAVYHEIVVDAWHHGWAAYMRRGAG